MKHITKYSENKRRRFVQIILQWGKDNKRTFPWRKDRTPYKVLLAEILLQRTPANRVARFFPKFCENFPSPNSIISTNTKSFVDFLHPMGLEKRAVWLTKIMNEICERHNCRIPNTEEELMQLSGIGRYTARAILIFAFNRDLAIVDVNVARVLQRVFGGFPKDKRPSENEKLWSFAAELVPKKLGPEYNESMLDFSAIICKTNPLCGRCPMADFCNYYSTITPSSSC